MLRTTSPPNAARLKNRRFCGSPRGLPSASRAVRVTVWLPAGRSFQTGEIQAVGSPASKVAAMVACYIGAAYWFTASTSFANPAAAFGRMFSDTFAGISPASVPGFVAAQLVGAGLGALIHRSLDA